MIPEDVITLVGIAVASALAMGGVAPWLAGTGLAPVLLVCADFRYMAVLAVFLAFLPSNDQWLDQEE